MYKDPVNEIRDSYGLGPVAEVSLTFDPSVPVIHIYSEYLLPRPTEWESQHYVVGPLFLRETVNYTPPNHLANFIALSEAEKRPLVYIGLGSMLDVIFDEDTEVCFSFVYFFGKKIENKKIVVYDVM